MIALHHSETTDEALISILKGLIDRPVALAEENMPLKLEYVYCLPSHRPFIVKGRCFQRFHEVHGHISSQQIDVLLTSLADDVETHAVGVILSGTGSDGTAGFKRIKQVGGLTIAHAPEGARYKEIQEHAITSDTVEWVLHPRDILPRIKDYIKEVAAQDLLSLQQPPNGEVFQRIFTLLLQFEQVDFSKYRPTTVLRRIERRMVFHQISSVESYLNFLEGNPEEIEELHASLLIGVTQFFRDPQYFAKLTDLVLAQLVRSGADHGIRIWVPGCFTGEEAYSLALALESKMQELRLKVDYKIFATDMDKAALNKASSGVYSSTSFRW